MAVDPNVGRAGARRLARSPRNGEAEHSVGRAGPRVEGTTAAATPRAPRRISVPGGLHRACHTRVPIQSSEPPRRQKEAWQFSPHPGGAGLATSRPLSLSLQGP